MPEAKRLISGLHDMAVMRQPVEQGGRHLGIAKDARPFGEGQIEGWPGFMKNSPKIGLLF